MDLDNTYFYTATILNWNQLFKYDAMKDVVVGSLEYLIKKKKVKVYGFVVMPNHIHLIWRNLEMNGKEFPDESFLKFSGHQFKNMLKEVPLFLQQFLVNRIDRKYQFWQRSPLPIEILSKECLNKN